MKNLLLVCVLASLVSTGFAAPYQPLAAPLTTFSYNSVEFLTNRDYVVIPPGRGTARVQYLNATSDSSTGDAVFYHPTNAVQITGAGSTASNSLVVGTSFASNDIVVVYFQTNQSYQRLTVRISTSTNITYESPLSQTNLNGDQIWKMTTNGTIRVGATATGITVKELNAGAGAIWNGYPGYPVLVEVVGNGTNTADVKINAVSGIYQP